ncbi:TPA: hypothetical protein ACX6MG_002693 [Photobacterium damselae]
MSNENLFFNLLQYATLSLIQGRTNKSIEIELMEDGLSQDVASKIVNRASEYKKKAVRKNGLKQIGISAGFIIMGGMITIATANNQSYYLQNTPTVPFNSDETSTEATERIKLHNGHLNNLVKQGEIVISLT